MISENTGKLIRFLLRNIDKYGYNINQLAKFLKISVGSSFKILKELGQDKIVTAQKIGNAVNCNLDLDNLETVKICELLILQEKRLLSGYAKLYGESIREFKNAELIVLFGSILTKKDFNDVDVLFITNKPKAVVDFCLELSKIRTKPVVPLILKREDLIKELKSKKEAIISLIKEGIILKGESLFVEVIKNAKQ